MSEFLKDIQVRRITNYSYNPSVGHDFTEWEDATGYTFEPNTQFRVKPKYTYRAVDGLGFALKSANSIEGLHEVLKENLEKGKTVGFHRDELVSPSVSSLLAERQVQFRINKDAWRSVVYMGSSIINGTVQLRLRPDTYFVVKSWHDRDQTIAEIEFDDVEDMLKYINGKSRTTENNFSVVRKPYV